jgi:N-acetyl-gamma-glutamyl-phosphate reductase
VYGFPEYDRQQRERLRAANRIANPGCYAIAAIAILHPLVASGLVPAHWPVSINGVSGYSGGGKALIAAFEDTSGDSGPRRVVYDYALGLTHKHVPEITQWAGLAQAPIFLPAVARYYKGMLVHVPLPLWALPEQPTPHDVHRVLAAHYAGEAFVRVAPFERDAAPAELDPEALNDSNELRLHVLHNTAAGQTIVVGQLDNLGKGASGQVLQTMNLLLGIDEARGL